MLSVEAQAVFNTLEKKFGQGSLEIAGKRMKSAARLGTGSLNLDVILGGGWPEGWSEIVGDESSGKTLICLKTVAKAQALNPDFQVAWIAAEHFYHDWAETCGVDNDRMIVVNTNVMEDAYHAALELANCVDLVVVDSLPALTPSLENQKDIGESTVGRGALLTGRFFRKWGTLRPDHPVFGIFINQWRQKIGVMYGDPRTTPGGVGKNFFFNVRLEVKRDSWIELGSKGNVRRIGMTTSYTTIKNKTAPPQQKAYVDFYFDQGGPVSAGNFDAAGEIVRVGILRGVVNRNGSWLYYHENKWQGPAALLQAIYAEPDLQAEITREVMAVL